VQAQVAGTCNRVQAQVAGSAIGCKHRLLVRAIGQAQVAGTAVLQ
jgi:hypothetical protein